MALFEFLNIWSSVNLESLPVNGVIMQILISQADITFDHV